jgi:hypothetical protein
VWGSSAQVRTLLVYRATPSELRALAPVAKGQEAQPAEAVAATAVHVIAARPSLDEHSTLGALGGVAHLAPPDQGRRLDLLAHRLRMPCALAVVADGGGARRADAPAAGAKTLSTVPEGSEEAEDSEGARACSDPRVQTKGCAERWRVQRQGGRRRRGQEGRSECPPREVVLRHTRQADRATAGARAPSRVRVTVSTFHHQEGIVSREHLAGDGGSYLVSRDRGAGSCTMRIGGGGGGGTRDVEHSTLGNAPRQVRLPAWLAECMLTWWACCASRIEADEAARSSDERCNVLIS